MPKGVVEASDDGVTFRPLATLPGEARQGLPVPAPSPLRHDRAGVPAAA